MRSTATSGASTTSTSTIGTGPSAISSSTPDTGCRDGASCCPRFRSDRRTGRVGKSSSHSAASKSAAARAWTATSRSADGALGGFFWGPGSTGPRRHPGSSRLRSTRLLSDYRVTAVDGDIGHVDGFLIDDRSWALCCLIVRTRHWPAGRRVLVPTEWVAWASWIELTVHVDLPVERILHGPDYDPSQPITAPDQTRVMAYYGRAPRDRRDTRPA